MTSTPRGTTITVVATHCPRGEPSGPTRGAYSEIVYSKTENCPLATGYRYGTPTTSPIPLRTITCASGRPSYNTAEGPRPTATIIGDYFPPYYCNPVYYYVLPPDTNTGSTSTTSETTSSDTSTSSTSSSTSTVPTTTSSSTAPAVCNAYQSLNAWPGGFQSSVDVRNISSQTFKPWIIRLRLPPGARLQNGWGGTATQFGDIVEIVAPPWYPELRPNMSVSIGFIGIGQGGQLRDITLNGHPCGPNLW